MLPVENNPSSLFSVLFFPLLFYGHPKIHSCLSTSLKTLVNFPFVVNCSLVPISVGGTAHPFFSADVNCSNGHLLYMLCHIAKHSKNTKRQNNISSIHSSVSEAGKCRKILLYMFIGLQED